mmetsp:Transcript_67908/g.136633  ORF Transcript_67908/g.136633 Transcript_67908/m.136633 type:complete len:97 (-) Transcript_67908:282-572(-)
MTLRLDCIPSSSTPHAPTDVSLPVVLLSICGTSRYVCSGDAAKSLSANGIDGVFSDTQWYVYAGALAFLVAFSKVISDIASDALASMDDDMDSIEN